jgi:hypothetical protein
MFLDSIREFYKVGNKLNYVEIPLVGQLRDGELAVVLTWNEGTKISGKQLTLMNLDLHVQF